MGLFSWMRRARQGVAPAGGPLSGLPIPGLLGGPARTAPAQRLPADVPAPLSTERLVGWLRDHGYSYFVDNDGDVGGLWRGRLFYFFCFGEHGEIFQVRGQWNRQFAIERLTEVLEICNAWNGDRLWPKAYVRVRDDGTVHVTCEVATDLEHGVTDDQLGQLVQCGLSSANVFFDELDDAYPDPASEAP
jgi:hypothetical protein